MESSATAANPLVSKKGPSESSKPSAFDSRTLCGVPASAAHPAARWLLPAGALLAVLPWTPAWAALLAGTALALTSGNP